MLRPCYLVVDREHSNGISTRKLVIETAKFNVVTAYSGAEGLEALDAYPRLAGVVVDGSLADMTCAEFTTRVKRLRPELTTIVVSAPLTAPCPDADYHIESFQPAALLELMKQLQPNETARIEQDNERLDRQGQ